MCFGKSDAVFVVVVSPYINQKSFKRYSVGDWLVLANVGGFVGDMDFFGRDSREIDDIFFGVLGRDNNLVIGARNLLENVPAHELFDLIYYEIFVRVVDA